MKTTRLCLMTACLLFGTVCSADAQLTFMQYPGVTFLRGYARTISGEPIEYHSFHPYAKSALLTRCTDGAMGIEWETEPVPDNFSGDSLRFVWVGGYSSGTSHGDRNFDLFINGKFLLRFTTRDKQKIPFWSTDVFLLRVAYGGTHSQMKAPGHKG